MEKIIDAKNKKIGRVASEAAKALMGKDNPNYQAHELADVKVIIKNVSLSDVTDKKLDEKTYNSYSGYPGGQKTRKMKHVVGKNGFTEIYEKAIYGMLPANRLRKQMMKNLTINE
mgnify:FL=1